MIKSLTSKLHIKQRLYSHRMTGDGSLEDHLAIFKEIIINLETLEAKYNEEDLNFIFLCSLPSSFTLFRDMILYSRNILTIGDACDAFFQSRIKHLARSEARDREGLIVHRSHGRDRLKFCFSNKVCFLLREKK